MLPDGFTLAPQDRWTDEIREETEGVYFSQYSDDQPNILLVGPIPGDQHQEIVFPVLSPNPATDSSIHFGKYQIHVGGNRGRGQVYPTGEKSNNAVYTAPATGTVRAHRTRRQRLQRGDHQPMPMAPLLLKPFPSVPHCW